MANLSSLMPPGARGYLAGEEQAQEAGSRNLAQLTAATQIRGQLEKLQQEAAARQAVAALGPDASAEDVVKALRPHVSPDKLVGLMQSVETQRLNRDARKETAIANLEAHRKQFYDALQVRKNLGEDANKLRGEAQLFEQYYKSKQLEYNTGQTIAPTVSPQAPTVPPTTTTATPQPTGFSPAQMEAVSPAGPSLAPRPGMMSPAEVNAFAPQASAVLNPALAATQARVNQAETQPGGGGMLPVTAAIPDARTGQTPTAPTPPTRELPGKLLDQNAAKVDLQRQLDQAKTMSPEELKAAGAQHRMGMPLNRVIPGFGKDPRRDEVRREAIAQIKAENPGMSDMQAGEKLANNQIAYVASNKSVGQLTAMLGATRQAVDQLDFNVKKTTESLDKLGNQETLNLSPVITAIARGEQKWTGNPAYGELFYYMHASAMESARLLQGGQASVAQLYQGAAEEAKKWADANFTTPATWKQGVAPAIMAEGHERIKTYERAIQAQQLGGKSPPSAPPASPGVTPAPPMALQYLKAHPETKDDFKAKFGYLP